MILDRQNQIRKKEETKIKILTSGAKAWFGRSKTAPFGREEEKRDGEIPSRERECDWERFLDWERRVQEDTRKEEKQLEASK